MQRGSSRWLAPAGACALVSGLCLLILWVQGPGGQPLLFTGPRGGYGGRWASCSTKNPQLGDFMRQATRNVGSHCPDVPRLRRASLSVGRGASSSYTDSARILPDRQPRIVSNLTGHQRSACATQTDGCVLQGHHDPLLPQSTDFASFVEEVRASLERHHLGWRPIDYLFSSDLPDGAHLKAVHPSCGGDYMVSACTLCWLLPWLRFYHSCSVSSCAGVWGVRGGVNEQDSQVATQKLPRQLSTCVRL